MPDPKKRVSPAKKLGGTVAKRTPSSTSTKKSTSPSKSTSSARKTNMLPTVTVKANRLKKGNPTASHKYAKGGRVSSNREDPPGGKKRVTSKPVRKVNRVTGEIKQGGFSQSFLDHYNNNKTWQQEGVKEGSYDGKYGDGHYIGKEATIVAPRIEKGSTNEAQVEASRMPRGKISNQNSRGGRICRSKKGCRKR